MYADKMLCQPVVGGEIAPSAPSKKTVDCYADYSTDRSVRFRPVPMSSGLVFYAARRRRGAGPKLTPLCDPAVSAENHRDRGQADRTVAERTDSCTKRDRNDGRLLLAAMRPRHYNASSDRGRGRSQGVVRVAKATLSGKNNIFCL